MHKCHKPQKLLYASAQKLVAHVPCRVNTLLVAVNLDKYAAVPTKRSLALLEKHVQIVADRALGAPDVCACVNDAKRQMSNVLSHIHH
jgi:hypothetical protein